MFSQTVYVRYSYTLRTSDVRSWFGHFTIIRRFAWLASETTTTVTTLKERATWVYGCQRVVFFLLQYLPLAEC